MTRPADEVHPEIHELLPLRTGPKDARRVRLAPDATHSDTICLVRQDMVQQISLMMRNVGSGYHTTER